MELPNRMVILQVLACVLYCLGYLSSGYAQTWQEKIVAPEAPALQVTQLLHSLPSSFFPLWETVLAPMIPDTLTAANYDWIALQKIRAVYHRRNFAAADSLAHQWLRRFPNSPWKPVLYLLRGELAFRQHAYALAEQFFAQAVSSARSALEIRRDSSYEAIIGYGWFWQAIALAHQGQYEDAALPLHAYLARYPNGRYADDALLWLGLFAESRFAVDTALQYYTTLIDRYPYRNTVLAAHLRAAQLALLQRMPQTVFAHVEAGRTILATPDRYEPQLYAAHPRIQLQYLEAEAYGMLQKYQQALAKIEALLQQLPPSSYLPYLHFSAGWMALNLQRYAKALALFDQVIFDTLSPHTVKAAAQLYYAVALRLSGDTAAAIRLLEGLTHRQAYPFRGAALLELGQIYYQRRWHSQARRTLERALNEATDIRTRIQAALLLGSLYLSQQLYDAAAKLYTEAEKWARHAAPSLLPDRQRYLAEIHFKGGVALVGNQQPAKAIEFFNRFLSEQRTDSRRPMVLFWLAEAYYRSKLYRNALAHYEALLEQFPAIAYREQILYGMAWSHFHLRHFSRAAALFERLLREFPHSPYALDALARKADALYLSKKFLAAANTYRQVVARAPHSELAQYCAYQVAQSLYRAHDYQGVLRETRRFLKLYPYASLADDALYLQGWTQFQRKEYQEAIATFQRLLDRFPTSPLRERTLYAIADAYYNAEEYEHAIATYQQFVQTYPNSPFAATALQSIQYCYVLLGKQQEAEKVIDNFTTQFPQTPLAQELYWRKADAFFSSGQYRDAAEEFQKFLERYPDHRRAAEALFWLAKSYRGMAEGTVRTQLLHQADSILQRLITRYPQTPFALRALFERGAIAKDLGNVKQADSLWAQLYALAPDSAIGIKALFERAYLKESIGDTATALQLYRFLANKHLDTDFGERSQFRIAAYFRDHKNYDSARKEFAKLIHSNSPIAAEAQYWIGELWLRQKHYARAAEAFRVVKRRFPQYERWYLLALLNLGYCYEKLGQWDQAAEQYRLILALRNDDEFARTARSRLEKLREKMQ